MTWRVIAQRLLTGEFLDWDLPLKETTTTRDLSGPGGIAGTLSPELRNAIALDGMPLIEEWSTALYVEDAGQIRAGGIVQNLEVQGNKQVVSAPGFASYPAGQPFVANYAPPAFQDPVKVFKSLWAYLQSFPDGDLGVQVVGDPTYLVLGDGAGPYNIAKHEYRDVGQELENIAQVCPFDYVESHAWNDEAHTSIGHKIEIGFPRIGRRRDDVRLAQGENITRISTVATDGNRFANTVYVLGNGEGAPMVVGLATTRDGRLRRATVVPRKAATQGLANVFARQELRGRELKFDISEVEIKEHPNTPIGAINPGDDVFVEVDLEHIGRTAMWLRVLSIEEFGNTPSRAVLKTMRSDFFVYASDTSPVPGKKVLVTI